MKVILHKLFPYAPYLNEYIGFEMDIPDDGDPIAEVDTLRKMAEKSHREAYPHLYESGKTSPVQSFETLTSPASQPTNEQRKQEAIKRVIDDINTCTSISEINKFKVEVGLVALEKIAASDPVTLEAYNIKLQSLK